MAGKHGSLSGPSLLLQHKQFQTYQVHIRGGQHCGRLTVQTSGSRCSKVGGASPPPPPPPVACVKALFRSHVVAQQRGKLKSSTSTPHGVLAGVSEVQPLPKSPSASWLHAAGQ
jgi:hypothetical protein